MDMIQDWMIINKIKMGDPDAWDILVHKYYDSVYFYCVRRCYGDCDIASDLTQDIFLKLVESLPRYRFIGKFQNYLYTMAVNTCNNYLKKRHIEQIELTDNFTTDLDTSLIDEILHDERKETVQKALDLLPEIQREVVILRYYHDLKVKDIATITGVGVDLLIQVGLDDVKNKKIRKYSGGMKQRLGIAQAMINNPEILILDEPTVGLDPKERVKFRKLISSFASEKIVLLSTHIVSDIEYIADEIIILKKGRIENTGTIRYLLKDINKCVWECLVPEKEVNRIEQVYTVSNRKYGEDGVVLRLISREKPFANAKQVDPVLEDLYLFYFREGE